jgi:hypothetical protein
MRKHASKFIGMSFLAFLLLILIRCTSLPLGPLNRIACGSAHTRGEARERREALKQIKSVGIVICSPDLHHDDYFRERLEGALSHAFALMPSTHARYMLFVYPKWSVKKRKRMEGPRLGRWRGSRFYPWLWSGGFGTTLTTTRWYLSFKARCSVVDLDKAKVLYSFSSRWDKMEVWEPFGRWTTREEYVLKGLTGLATKIAMELFECKWCD